MPKERRYDASLELMDLSIEVVEEVNTKLGRNLTMQDLIAAGFGMPSVKMDCLQSEKWIPESGDRVWEYLQYNKYLLESMAEEIKEEASE